MCFNSAFSAGRSTIYRLLDKLSRSVAMNSSDFMSNGLLAFPFSGIRVVFFTDRSGGDVEAANRGRIVSYDEEYMV